MNKSTWQATIGSGTLLRDVTKHLHLNGNRAIAHGTCPQVGIGGHATIGGLGPSSRMWGSALDHIEEVEVVLANSSIIRASSTQNTDIFWALRGAAASFGIITEFKFRTQPEPRETVLYSYSINGGSAKAKAFAFKQWQTLIADPTLSHKFATNFIMTELGVVITGTYFGSASEFASLNISARLPQKSEHFVVLDGWLGVISHWAEDMLLELIGDMASNFYVKSLAYTKDDLIPDATVDKLFEYIDTVEKGTMAWFLIFDLQGGKINDYAADATAYGHRDVLFYHQAYGVSLLGRVNDKVRDYITGINEVITEGLGRDLGVYAGYVDRALGEDGQSRYWRSNLPRLQRVKRVVDPDDVFSNPQSVRVAT
jgi:FAD/FMN-containing dehydrogenase